MPLFYFDMRHGDELFIDEEGLWSPNFESAEREAFEAARTVLQKTAYTQVTVEVRDEMGQRRATAFGCLQVQAKPPDQHA